MSLPRPHSVSHFKAMIKAIAVLPGPRYKNLTADGIGESKPAARALAESSLREQLEALRGEFGANVALQFSSTPIYDEVDPRA